jgi:membrane protease YdiL (CAAX protease family)
MNDELRTDLELVRDDLVVMDQRRPPHPDFWWALLWCVAFLISVVVLSLVVAIPMLFALKFWSGASALEQALSAQGGFLTWITGISIAIEIVFALVVLRFVVGGEWRREIAVRLPSVTHLILVLLSFLPMVLLSNGVYELIKLVVPDVFALVGMRDPMEFALEMAGSWPLSVAVLLIGVGPALAEELWCRGFLGRGLVGNYGAVAGVFLTSFLFGSIHLVPRQGIAAMFLGLWLHFAYLATRSLLVPMLLHFMNNALAVASLRIPGIATLETPPWLAVSLYSTGALLFIVVAWTLYRCRARLLPPQGEPDYWPPAYPGVECPPSWSLTTITHPWPNWIEIGLLVLIFGAFVTQIVLLAASGAA